MLRIVGIALAALVLVVLAGLGSLYIYLAPEGPPHGPPVPEAARSIESGDIIGFAGEQDTLGWLGIPFAAPPVGDLRWRPPAAAIPWQGQRETTSFGDGCVQFTRDSTKENPVTEGSEDCLTLNVFAPASATAAEGAGLPVMFWIHGGGNTIGSASDSPYNGALLAASQNVIVVTTNYRLGAFGWFTHWTQRATASSPEDASGNFGTLDLIAGLNWVRGNIAAFGGDPGNVTIFGESAGGLNVMALMVSPLARDLFHRAIVQSGGLRLETVAEAEQLSENRFGKPKMTSREMIARLLLERGRASSREAALAMQDHQVPQDLMTWLRGIPGKEVYSVLLNEGPNPTTLGMFDAPSNIKDGYVLPNMTNEEILSDPANYARVPVMLGTNRDEGKLFMAFNPLHVTTTDGGLPTGIKDPETYNRISRFGSRLWWGRGVDLLAHAMSGFDPGNIYAYRFDADDWRDYGWLGGADLKELLGAAHALEVLFLFGYLDGPVKLIIPGSLEIKQLSDSIMAYWGAFAHTGSPGRGTGGNLPTWQPWNHDTGSSFILLDTSIGDGIRMRGEMTTLSDAKAQMMVELSALPLEERCFNYNMSAWGEDFVDEEYALLGCTED